MFFSRRVHGDFAIFGTARKKEEGMAKYSSGSQKTVEKAMHKYKRGKLKSGASGKTVKSRKQAIAIGLSEAREKGQKAPKKKSPSSRKSK
jgi:hypothetical protein